MGELSFSGTSLWIMVKSIHGIHH
jgi:hypothetical protein